VSRVSIIGAGMAGLLAGAMFRRGVQVFEAAPQLPNNHHALLRFRSDEIAHHLNIPFDAVEVVKITKPWRNQVADAVGYSLKSNGRASFRSITSAEGRINKRFIAPHDFIQQLEDLQPSVCYNVAVNRKMIDSLKDIGPIISTIPMGALMDILGYRDKPEFGYRHAHVIKVELQLPSDLCATIYYPDPGFPVVRATLTGDLLQVELVSVYDAGHWTVERILQSVFDDFGLMGVEYTAELHQQKYAKIVPIDDRERRKFIMWATDNFGIYSLGRFAVWKPGLLLDDVFHDCHKVIGMIRAGHNYDGRLAK
jgi:hypothetical protein